MLGGRPVWWRSIRTRIIAWSFIPTAIILVAVALVTFYAYQRVTEDLVVQRNREVTRLSASQLATGLQEYAQVLDGLARLPDLASGVPATQRAALSAAGNRLAAFDAGAVVLDSHGAFVGSLPVRPTSAAVEHDWSSRSYFRKTLRLAGPAYSDIVADGPGGKEVIAVAVPITGSSGEFIGTLAGLFRAGATSVSAFYGDLVKLRIGQSGTVYLVDGAGRLIYAPDPTDVGHPFAATAITKEVLAGKVGALRTRAIDGHDTVAGYAPVPGTSWGLVAVEDWASVMQSSQSYRRFLLGLIAIGVVVPSLVVTLGVRRLTRPLEALTGAAREVAGGNFDRTIEVSSRDEIAALAEQFNRMSVELRNSYSQLEQRVADRTKELATLNAVAAVVSGTLDLDRILEDSLAITLRSTGIEGGATFRLDDQGTPSLAAHQGLSPAALEFVGGPLLEGWPEWVGATDLSTAVLGVDDFSDSPLRGVLVAEGVHIVIRVPLVAKGKVLGAMILGSREPIQPTAEDLELLSAIGGQVGLAAENARLYEHAEQAATAAERNRLARDLHDAVSQTLFSATLIAEVLPRVFQRDPAEGERRLEELRQLTRGALAEMRALLLELRPATLAEAELADLLRQLGEAMTGRARIPVTLEIDSCVGLPPDVKVALYRIAQEALNNVAKHSAATSAAMSLSCGVAGVRLTVADDGQGFDPAAVGSDRLGLSIMQERAEAIGASLVVETAHGRGTHVVAEWSPASPPAGERGLDAIG